MMKRLFHVKRQPYDDKETSNQELDETLKQLNRDIELDDYRERSKETTSDNKVPTDDIPGSPGE
jgi:hypothetical protein